MDSVFINALSIFCKKVIKNIVNQTLFATSMQESRPILTGINLKIEGNKMECIATDSYRLAKKIVELDSAVENLINIVIPGKNIGELAKILNDNDENVEIHIFSNKILFKFDNILFQSRLLNGTFPDTSRLIPDTFELEIKTDLDELYSVIDRAALLTSEKEKNVIKFETNENEAIVSSNTPEIGRVEERLAITKNNDKEITDKTRVIDDTAFNSVIENENNSEYKALSNYFINQTITDKNDYTGMFKDKNLIVIMMESANDIFINPEYYPNFYNLYTEGWSWENNYSPRNSCATMNNEFSGMTSLYSIYNTCTASKYKANTYYESIFNLFNRQNYVTFSSHDYTEAYYPRSTIHKNMGSGEYYGVQKLGIKYSNEYINWANDDEFMEAVLKIIDKKTSNNEHFMTWLTTVSSHQPYSSSSIQGDKYYSMTDGTGYSSDVRRYMSKLKILDNGLGILLEGLRSRGILDDTVIVLYGDHYPYGISKDHLNEVLDYDTNEDMNAEQVPFVIYNSTIEPKKFSEYTFYLNILPTIANLFDLDYDPRLYLGTDLFSSDAKSLTVFADGSWKNEIAYYNAKKNKIKYYTDKTYTTEELNQINNEITTKVNISNKVIKENYFEHLGNSLEEENRKINELSNIMCLNSEKDKYTKAE